MYYKNTNLNKYLYFEYKFKFERVMVKFPWGSHLDKTETIVLF